MNEKLLNLTENMFKDNLLETDPEYAEIIGNFIFEETSNEIDLDSKTKYMAILATLLGLQGLEAFKRMLLISYENGLSYIEIKEIVYQATAYLGIGRVYPFLYAVNEFIKNSGEKLPLEPQNDLNSNRIEKGSRKQVELFGEHMKDFYKNGDSEFPQINRWLAANCFGDYYTRGGLNNNQREMITFCYLMAQGGCEPQLQAHASANIRLGNNKSFLYKIISVCVPFMGYPRTLNALKVVKEI